MILTKQLGNQGLHGLEFVVARETISEISLILNSEVSKKSAVILNLAVVLKFFKTDLNGEETTVQPVFCSTNFHLNNVNDFNTELILKDSLSTITVRFDDFISKGSGIYGNQISLNTTAIDHYSYLQIIIVTNYQNFIKLIF